MHLMIPYGKILLMELSFMETGEWANYIKVHPLKRWGDRFDVSGINRFEDLKI